MSSDPWVAVIGIVGTIVAAAIAGFRMLYKDKAKAEASWMN